MRLLWRNNKWKYVCEKAAEELSGLKERPFRLTKNTFSGKQLPKHHSQMQNWEKAVCVEASALTGAQHSHPSTEGSNLTQQEDGSTLAAHHTSSFPSSGTRGDIWHMCLPNREQAAAAAPCLRATEPEVSKNLKWSNHHNNCWLMNMRTKQQTKNWFATVSKGSPREAVSASHPAHPWLCAEHQSSRPAPLLFWWKSWWEWVNEWVKSIVYNWKSRTQKTAPKNHFASLKQLHSFV